MKPELPSIAITGIGFVTPIGQTESHALSALKDGRSGIRPVLLDDILPILMGRVSEDDFPRHGGEMAIDYGVGASRNAWKMAGLQEGEYDPWMAATVVGSSKGRLASLLGDTEGTQKAFDAANFPGKTLGTCVAQDLKFAGPVLNYPAACASGIHCIIRAAQLLQNKDADVALAGSGEASGKALLMASFKNMGALSDDPIRPFDRRRSGFNPGEGAAVFTLEREDDARARGAQVLALIRGWDQRSDAHHMTAADPTGVTVVYSIRRALAMAGWEPDDVEYINAHGTGTPLNDVVEGRAIQGAFGINGPLVSSLKPNIGHLLGASSAVELALSIIMLRNSFIAPTLGLEQPDPEIPLQFVSPGGIDREVHRFMKISLGFGGHIGVLAVELP